jgi:hypothetical protein
MTTIRECTKGRAKLVSLFGIGGYTLTVMPFISAPRAHVPLAALILWVALVMVVTLAGMFLLSRRVRCPNCKTSLFEGAAYNLAVCPNCQTSMEAPYPHRRQR